jgi:galactan endo-1,6-beta-galactosidase
VPLRKFYVLAQYSRHIRPGDTIVEGGEGDTVAALSTRGGVRTLVLVKFNKHTAQWVNFDLSASFKGAKVASGAKVARWCTEPESKNGERYHRHDDTKVGADGSVSVYFEKNTIMTLEIPVSN